MNIDLAELASVSDAKIDEALEQIDISSFRFSVIVSLPKANCEADIDEAGAREGIQGTILFSVDQECRDLLEESYPNVDIDGCHVLVAGRKPFSANRARLYCVGGALSILVTLGIAARNATRMLG